MQHFTIQFQNLNLWILLIFGITMVILFLILRRSDRIAERWQRILLLIRFLILLLILLIIVKPILKWTSVRQLEPEIKVFVDQSASMLKHENISRDSLITLVGQLQAEFQKRGFGVAIYPFSNELADNPVSMKGLQFNHNGTDLSKVLSKGIRQSGNSNVSAGVLITDGVSTQGEDPILMDIQSDFPVYPIGIGDSLPLFDPAVLEMTMPAIVTTGDSVVIEARILPLGRSKTIQVFLHEGKKRIQTKKVKTTSQNLYQTVGFEIVIDQPGIFQYSVMIDTTQDQNPYNNLRSASVRVKPSRTTFILIQGRASFEARYFKQLLQSIPGMKIISLLETQSGWYSVDSKDPFREKWDAVALFGFPTPNTSAKILNLVREKITRDYPAIYIQYLKGLSFDRLEHLLGEQVFLSYVIEQNNRSITVQIAEEYRSHPIVRDLNNLTLKSGWSELPPIGMPFRNFVLADYLKGVISSVGSQLLPVLAVGTTQRSRMTVVTGIDLWRWEMMTVESENHLLYSELGKNLIKWLTDTLSTSNLQLSINKEIFLTGEFAEVRGIVSDVQGNLVKNAVINAQLVDARNNSLPFLIQWDGFQYRGLVPMQAEGECKIEAVASVGGNPIGSFQQKVAVLENSIESQSLRLNIEALRSIALKTGGKYYPGDKVDTIADSVPFKKVQLDRVHELKLWRWKGIFIILILLFFTEWTIRRIVGYQ